MGRSRLLFASLLIAVIVIGFAAVLRAIGHAGEPSEVGRVDALARSDDPCVRCHRNATPGIVEQFGVSTMAAANVKCGDCHIVKSDVPGAVEHEGTWLLPSPTTTMCRRCHEAETLQFLHSRHGIPAYVAYAGAEGLTDEQLAQYRAIPEGQFDPHKLRNALFALEGPDVTRSHARRATESGAPPRTVRSANARNATSATSSASSRPASRRPATTATSGRTTRNGRSTRSRPTASRIPRAGTTIRPDEWIPIIFGPIAGAILVVAGLVNRRQHGLAVGLAAPVYLASIAIGLLGAYFHLNRAVLPWAPAGERVTFGLLVWGPPIIAPLTFALVGMFGLSALWIEEPPDSGTLLLPGRLRLRLPFSKTRAYFLWVSLGMLATLISSVLDHAHTDFSDAWLWVPTAAGVAGTVLPLLTGFLEKPSRSDLIVYIAGMGTIVLVGLIGIPLHARTNLVVQGGVVGERFIRGAPLLAPLLFADIAAFGLLVLLDSDERATGRRRSGSASSRAPY